VGDQIELPVQVGGRTRSKVHVPRNATEPVATAAALADPGVHKFTAGKEIKKVIYVPNRLINIVLAG
jgi:leucyl-tRNA synthetase